MVHAFCHTSEHYAILATRLADRGKVLGVRRNIGYWHTWRSRWTARLFAALGARYAANCEAACQFAAKVEWIPRDHITVIRNPVPTKCLAEGLAAVPPRSALGLADGERVVGMVAEVRPIKDYETFCRAARLVLDEHPNTRFFAIGPEQADYARRVRQLACQLGIDAHVTWMGPLPNPLSVVALMDVAVLSSRSEAFSNAVLEYGAAGVPAVATDVGGTRELIDDGRTGFLVPPQSPEVMAERICRLLADADLRKTLGDAARQKVQKVFSEERILNEYGRMYSRLAGREQTVDQAATPTMQTDACALR